MRLCASWHSPHSSATRWRLDGASRRRLFSLPTPPTTTLPILQQSRTDSGLRQTRTELKSAVHYGATVLAWTTRRKLTVSILTRSGSFGVQTCLSQRVCKTAYSHRWSAHLSFFIVLDAWRLFGWMLQRPTRFVQVDIRYGVSPKPLHVVTTAKDEVFRVRVRKRGSDRL